MDNNCIKPEYGLPLTESVLRHTVFRTSRARDSIDPRFSVPSFTYTRRKPWHARR